MIIYNLLDSLSWILLYATGWLMLYLLLEKLYTLALSHLGKQARAIHKAIKAGDVETVARLTHPSWWDESTDLPESYTTRLREYSMELAQKRVTRA